MEPIYTLGVDEAKEIAKHFKTEQKGAFEHRYVDMPAAVKIMQEWREKKGLGYRVGIMLKPEVKPKKGGTFIKNYKNNTCPFTGLLMGKFRGIHPATGMAQWSNIELSENREFNLMDDVDAADWIILRLSTAIEDSVNANKGYETKYWKFVDNRAENVDSVNKVRDIVKISEIIESMSGYEMLNLARLHKFQINPGDELTVKIVDIHGFLLKTALEDPTSWLKKYKDGNRSYYELINAGQATGIIESSIDGYSAMGNFFGRTLEEAVAFLKQEKNLKALVQNSITEQDIAAKRMEEQKPEKTTKKEKLNAIANQPKELVDVSGNENDIS